MATFTGSENDDTYAGTGENDVITSGGGLDLLSGAGGDDRFIIDFPLFELSLIDGGPGTDTLVLKTYPGQLVEGPLQVPVTSQFLLPFIADIRSIERIEFDSTAGTQVQGVFGFGFDTDYPSQIGGGQIAANAVLIGGAGLDSVVLVVPTGAANLTYSAPAFTYSSWLTPTRPYDPSDTVAVLVSGNGVTLNGSAHQGVQYLSIVNGGTVNGSDDMDYITGGNGVQLNSNGGDDAFAIVDAIAVQYNAAGQVVGQARSITSPLSGIYRGGEGVDWLVLGGEVSVTSALDVDSIEGIYLSPAYAAVIIPEGVSQRQDLTLARVESTWLEQQMPDNLRLDGEGILVVVLPSNDHTFDASDYQFDADADIGLLIAGNSGNDTIFGSSSVDLLSGGDGNDVLTGNADDDIIQGDAGRDTAVFAGAHTAYTVARNSDGTLTTTGPDGVDTLDRIEVLRFGDGDFVWNEARGFLPAPQVSGGGLFRLFLGEGFSGGVGGVGIVSGTIGFEEVRVIGDGNIINFDPTFNRGGDVIRLTGSATDYFATRSGSQIVLTNDVSTYSIPVGLNGTSIVFDDDAGNLSRQVRFVDGNIMRLGSQTITSIETAVTATDALFPIPSEGNVAATARMFVGIDATVSLDGDYTVNGSATGAETIDWLGGDLNFDSTFNRGGDTLISHNSVTQYEAYVSGSRVILIGPDGAASVPAGQTGMALEFAPEGQASISRELHINTTTGAFMIGTQIISATSETTAVALIA